MDVEVLSWLFTESLIRQCFDVSMRTVNKKGKQAICEFINQMCGVNADDVSAAEDQCESLIGAVTVCIFILLIIFAFSLLYLCFLIVQNGDENSIRHEVGMKVFIEWIKEGEEHAQTFENSTIIQMGKRYLRGNWKTIRKIRLVRFIRRLIEEGITTEGVKGIFEEGCRMLSDMERSEDGGREEEDEKKEKEEYLFELYLLRVRGDQKKLKADEVSILRRKLEEEKARREESERKTEEEKRRADEEKRKREESEKRNLELQKQLECTKNKPKEEMKPSAEDERWIQKGGTHMHLMKSLDGLGVEFGDASLMRKENNYIIHNDEEIWASGFVGGNLDNNSVHRMFE